MAAILFFKIRPKFSQAKHLKARTFDGQSLYSEVIAPIITEKQGCFSVTTSFNLEPGLKGQIQHLEKIPCP